MNRPRTLPPTDRKGLPGAIATLALVRIALPFIPPRRWATWGTRPTGARRSPAENGTGARDVAAAVRRASRVVPGSTCLVQAVATQALLSRRGYDSNLRIGVARGAHDGLRAHAWLESEGSVLIGDSGLEAYTPLTPRASTSPAVEPATVPEAKRRGLMASTATTLGRILELGARDWRTSRAVTAVMLVVPFVVLAVGMFTALLGKEAYEWFVAEDRFAETLQVFAFAAASVFSLLTAARLRASGERLLGALFLVAGLGLVWVTGEEVSWGQRIFGWTTPETLLAVNRQNESNVHNILPIEIALRWVQFAVGAWATLVPILLLKRPALFQKWPIDLTRFVPHFTLIPYFACTLFWRAYRNVFEPPSANRYFFAKWSEVIELNLALGIMLFLLYEYLRTRRSTERVGVRASSTSTSQGVQ